MEAIATSRIDGWISVAIALDKRYGVDRCRWLSSSRGGSGYIGHSERKAGNGDLRVGPPPQDASQFHLRRVRPLRKRPTSANTTMPDPRTVNKQQAAKEVLDVLSEISDLLVSSEAPKPI